MSAEQQTSRKILVVDDDQDFRWAMGNVLQAAGYRVIQAQDGKEAMSLLEKDIPDLVLLDYRMPGRDGLHVARDMKQRIPAVPILIITAYAEVASAVEAMKMGVYDYVTKPVDNNDLIFTIKRALEKQDLIQEVEHLRKALTERASLYELMGKSDQIKKLVQLLEKAAPTPFTVLIQGESGTGKELVARAIHDLSLAKEGPFVAVDCGAIPETLIESELFGYMRGAFTGAHTDKPGQFELANGGTLFLDEVGNLPYLAQQKLLRAMQERCIQRLGAKKTQPIQVRIIAATNQPLENDVEAGRFRSDLYFRLKEFSITVPPLRRRTDIFYLAKKFVNEAEGELKKKCAGISKNALSALFSYPWPGNVRELRNVIRQAVLLCEENGPINTEHLMLTTELMPGPTEIDPALSLNLFYNGKKSLKEQVKSFTDALEKRIIKEALTETKGNKSKASRKLGIDYKTLLRKIKMHQLNSG
ncbi:MAG: sigma-54 dependent transcriptional regulator [Syntrophales bacterium]|nr:sigma-54 dependent transcriptional regulator [Syntrophales bacterium]